MKWTELIKKYRDEQQRFWRRLRQQRMIHGQQRQLDDLYREVREQARPVFVLSTGRAGTKLLTRLLESSKELMPVHEPAPELAYHSALAYREPTGSEALKMAIDLARYEYIRDAYLVNQRYVETNNRISFFAYYLAELYPQARFIHLVRHPEDFIRSGVARNWYRGQSIYDEGRIRDEARFKDWRPEQRVAWLWSATNNFILRFAGRYPQRSFQLKSETLFAGRQEELNALWQFLGLDDITTERVRSVTGRVENKGQGVKAALDWRHLEAVAGLTQTMTKFNYSRA